MVTRANYKILSLGNEGLAHTNNCCEFQGPDKERRTGTCVPDRFVTYAIISPLLESLSYQTIWFSHFCACVPDRFVTYAIISPLLESLSYQTIWFSHFCACMSLGIHPLAWKQVHALVLKVKGLASFPYQLQPPSYLPEPPSSVTYHFTRKHITHSTDTTRNHNTSCRH